jgi:MarR family transcriptional regulator, transcriptional regulator for hemolysin
MDSKKHDENTRRHPAFALDASLGFLLNKAALAMRRALDGQLAPHGLTAPQWSLLARIATQGGLTQVALGELSLFDRATTTGILARLEARGLISRRTHPDDPRAKAVHLTPAGASLYARLPGLAERVNTQASQGIGASDRRRLVELLEAIAANFDSPEAPGSDFVPDSGTRRASSSTARKSTSGPEKRKRRGR